MPWCKSSSPSLLPYVWKVSSNVSQQQRAKGQHIRLRLMPKEGVGKNCSPGSNGNKQQTSYDCVWAPRWKARLDHRKVTYTVQDKLYLSFQVDHPTLSSCSTITLTQRMLGALGTMKLNSVCKKSLQAVLTHWWPHGLYIGMYMPNGNYVDYAT